MTRISARRISAIALAIACCWLAARADAQSPQHTSFVVGRVAEWPQDGCSSCATQTACDCVAQGGKGAAQGGKGEGGGPSGDLSDEPQYDYSLLSSRYSSYRGTDSAMPTMIGDFFANGLRWNSSNGELSVATAGGDRRFKFNEHMSAIPIDRVFFAYNHFHNALIDINGVSRDLDRYLFGVEKTLLEGLWSVEFRVPIVGGVVNDQVLNTTSRDPEFGNMALAVKRRVIDADNFVASIGLGIVFPTGEAAQLFEANSSSPAASFENESVHLLPFFGFYHAVNDRLFHQFFTQLDFDTVGNAFSVTDDDSSLNIPLGQGVVQDQTLLFLDYSVGYWMYRNYDTVITGVAPMIELHYSTTLDDLDVGSTGTFINNFRTDVLNLTAGVLMEVSSAAYMQLAGVAPLRQEFDKQFDAEINFYYVQRY